LKGRRQARLLTTGIPSVPVTPNEPVSGPSMHGLCAYVAEMANLGSSSDEIRQGLIEKGCTPEGVDQILAGLNVARKNAELNAPRVRHELATKAITYGSL